MADGKLIATGTDLCQGTPHGLTIAEENDGQLRIKRGEEGNINFTGDPKSCSSFLLTRWHPSFLESLEPGVRELVSQLISSWDCVTYSSCEGHKATNTEPMRMRNVRIGTRSPSEHSKLIRRVAVLCQTVNQSMARCSLRLYGCEANLSLSEGFEAPGVDILFLPESDDEMSYWKDIEGIYKRAVATVGKVDMMLRKMDL